MRLKLASAIFHYFWKNMVLLGYFERNILKRNLTYSGFIFPLFPEHLFSPALPRAVRLLKTCFEKITVCVMETMLVTLPVVQTNKARREMNQQIKPKSRQENAEHFSNREELETTNVVKSVTCFLNAHNDWCYKLELISTFCFFFNFLRGPLQRNTE